jgi:hypothetical protein
MKEVRDEVRQFSDATWERLLKAIDEAYGIRLALVTQTPDGSSIADFPVDEGAQEKLSELLGFPINGDEFLYEIAAQIERQSTNNPAIAGKRKETMSNQEVSSQEAIPEFLTNPAKQRPDEFMHHGIVAEFAKRSGWVRYSSGLHGLLDWTPLFLTEGQAESLEHLIEAQGFLTNEGLTTTPKEIFDAVQTLFNRGQTVFSHTELGEVIKEQRQTGTVPTFTF